MNDTTPYGADRPDAPHSDVGAYALGLLGDAEASRFEEHLAGCPRCAEELEANLAVGALLRDADAHGGLPDGPGDGPGRGPGTAGADGERILGRLLAGAAADRRRTRRGRRALVGVAAAAVLLAGGVTVPVLTGQDETPPAAAEAVRAAFEDGEKFSDQDPSTSVEATVSLQPRAWGTHVTLRIGNLTGPRACDLIAVGEDGRRLTIGSWSVPGYGYGIEGTRWEEPLYVSGGAALSPDRIDHFEVRTLEGEKLAAIRL